MHILIFNRCFKLTRKVCIQMSNHLTFLLLRSDCGGPITFPTAWIVGKERPQSRLYLDREYKMCFAQANWRTNVKNLLAWSALNRWPSSSKAPTSLHNEPEVTGSSKIHSLWLLWTDVFFISVMRWLWSVAVITRPLRFRWCCELN